MTTPKGSPKRGLAGATLGFFVGFAAVALFGPMTQRLRAELSLSPVTLGFALASPLLSGSLLRIPFSSWVDTTGGRKPFLVLLSLSTLGMVGLLLLFNFTTADHLLPGSFSLLLVLGVLCGCGIATFSVGVGQVSYWFPQSEQGLALGIYAGLGNTAPGIFSFLLPVAIAAWGVAGAYLAWFIFLLIGTLAYAIISQDAPYFQLRRRGIRDPEAQRIAREHGQQIFPGRTASGGLVVAARRWRTWALVSLYLATFGGFLALTAWLPVYWSLYLDLTPEKAGGLTALFSISASLARIVGGYCADRFEGEPTARLALSALAIGALLMSCARSLRLSVAAVLLMAVAMGVNNGAVFKLVAKYVPEAVGGASGWVGGLGAGGGFALPPLMGWIAQHDATGYASSFLLFAALGVICLFLAGALEASARHGGDLELVEESA